MERKLPWRTRQTPRREDPHSAVEPGRAGTPIPANDLAIAALALYFEHELLVGPRDEAEFRRIPGLSLRVLGA